MVDKFILQGPTVQEALYDRSLGIKMYETLKELSKTDKIALLNAATSDFISYKDLFESSIKVAIQLKKLGLTGKIIGVCSENRADFFIPVIAALYIGSPVTTLSHGYTAREMLHACGLVEPSIVFCSNATFATFKTMKLKVPMKYLNHVWILQNLQKFYNNDININQFRPNHVNPKEQIAGLLFSSGTTGLPKAVAITHSNISFSYRQSMDSDHLMSALVNYLMCLPFYHGYGFIVMLLTLMQGNTIRFIEKFDPVIFLSAIEKYKIRCLTLVPPLMVFLAKHSSVDQYDLTSVKIILCAAASCSKELEMAVLKRLNNNIVIYQGYGMTELAAAVITVKIGTVSKNGSVGTVDRGVQVKFRNPETNHSLGPNNVGEICVRSESVMKGYYGNPDATAASITDDGWFLTGDLGYYDNDGFIFIVDRLKELIKFKGFQVPPAELEGLLCAHPKVLDAAVVGLPDEAAGELPLAFVVRKPGVELSEQEVKDFIKAQVSYVKQLHGGVRFVKSIPKSPAGKILRRELRDLLTAEIQNIKLGKL